MTGRWPWGFLRLIMGEITCSLLWARVPSEPTLEHDPRPFGATVKARSEVEEKAARGVPIATDKLTVCGRLHWTRRLSISP